MLEPPLRVNRRRTVEIPVTRASRGIQMNVWEPEKILLFLAFFMPGFISIKVYELIVATRFRDFSTSILEAVGYSVLNFAVLSWLILWISSPGFSEKNPASYSISIVLIFFVIPALWPLLFVRMSRWKVFKKHILSPINMPWDEVFSKREALWVIIHMKDGRKIGGKYGARSRASAFPNQRQIYLESLWRLDENNAFREKVERTRGAVFFQEDISIIEFFE
jgi:hypothetical protein